ncbi:hypothetical protein GCM10022381_16500 [Leifsonia kafniensis]|uniref:Cell wall-binding repeat-containing protein n=1 Tax=Leifsonia kafniensis TaxID=475957 RepID=A0ABP7KDY0_9MICO
MNMLNSRIKRGLGCIAASSLILGGASFALAAPASATTGGEIAPVAAAAATSVVPVTVNDIAPNESKYLGWHEGYTNATPAFRIATDGLHLGIGAPSQILNGLVASGKPGIATTDLLALITGASTSVRSGAVTFQVAVTWGTGASSGWATLRSDELIQPVSTIRANDLWVSSKAVGAIAADTPTTVKSLTDELKRLGNVRYSGFGVQADAEAAVGDVTWDGTKYAFTVVTDRIAGDNRYDTAVKISQSFAPGASRLYVTSGQDFPDALSAGPAAAHFESPLLLTTQDTVPANVAAEIKRLNPDEVVVVGGTTAVSAQVETQIESIVGADAVMRVSGADRYETSRNLALDAFGKADTAYVATGANFPDALAAGPAAVHFDGPVVLVAGWGTTVDEATKTLLDNQLGVKTVNIVGGEVAVSHGVIVDLQALVPVVARFWGADRYVTASEINKVFGTSDRLYLATGTGFADALSGAALAGLNDSPLYVTTPDCLQEATTWGIVSKAATEVTLLGGPDVLSRGIASLTSCK